ncbi:hypothetical protein K7X08_023192 [Anisodus acutangulus]|uniref:Uncharacterized protein n=1 Tax=Anisodus acutangulus TaxID=402998 RepID=A0A9Q1R2F6_9SOLA|nr:hypothetical protein K7X08_023192 [Anisodus acutangulus]
MTQAITLAATTVFVTHANGIQQRLPPLTFGSFIPSQFQSIQQGVEATGIDEAALSLVLPPITKGQKTYRTYAPCRLQFSSIGTSTTPAAAPTESPLEHQKQAADDVFEKVPKRKRKRKAIVQNWLHKPQPNVVGATNVVNLGVVTAICPLANAIVEATNSIMQGCQAPRTESGPTSEPGEVAVVAYPGSV